MAKVNRIYRVLVVDDEAPARNGIVNETDWEALSCEVAGEAKDGLEGLELARRVRPDLIICDIRMPKMDGLDMVRHLRGEGIAFSVIFLTAYSDFSYAQSAVRLQAADYILKPFAEGELESAILRFEERAGQEAARAGAGTQMAGTSAGGVQADAIGAGSQAGAAADGGAAADRLIADLTALPEEGLSRYSRACADYITANFADKEISVKKIAEALNISESHLSHIFRKETGMTINSYLTGCRMAEAVRLLRTGEKKVYEIAELVGYRDLTYFSATFKKVTGSVPSDFLKSAGQ